MNDTEEMGAELREYAAEIGKLRARVKELEALAYLGDHHFPDLTYKARLEETAADLRSAQSVVTAAQAVITVSGRGGVGYCTIPQVTIDALRTAMEKHTGGA